MFSLEQWYLDNNCNLHDQFNFRWNLNFSTESDVQSADIQSEDNRGIVGETFYDAWIGWIACSVTDCMCVSNSLVLHSHCIIIIFKKNQESHNNFYFIFSTADIKLTCALGYLITFFA